MIFDKRNFYNRSMKYFIACIFCLIVFTSAHAQNGPSDTIPLGQVTITQDERIVLLGNKMAEYNDRLSTAIRPTKGYRLMLLSTSDRNLAMKVRSQLLQQYPDQKVYMAFQTPYIKLKFGNFVDKEEAEKFRKAISTQRIVTGNIYVLPETIEVKADKLKEAKEE